MKKLTFFLFITISTQLVHAQFFFKKANGDSTEISAWEHLNTELNNWEYIKHVFVPTELGLEESDTMLIETLTLSQHKQYFKKIQRAYYHEKKIDTLRARYRPEMPDFLSNQELETNQIIDGVPFAAKAVNLLDIKNEDIKNCRFVLKKKIKIHHLNHKTAHGDVFIEYFFYDRKLNKEYPHMSTTLDRLIIFISPEAEKATTQKEEQKE